MWFFDRIVGQGFFMDSGAGVFDGIVGQGFLMG